MGNELKSCCAYRSENMHFENKTPRNEYDPDDYKNLFNQEKTPSYKSF